MALCMLSYNLFFFHSAAAGSPARSVLFTAVSPGPGRLPGTQYVLSKCLLVG